MKSLHTGAPKKVPSLGSSWGPPIFVWGIWGLLFFLGLDLIRNYHSCIPYWEDWFEFVPYLIGSVPDTGEWLWQQETEHRFPLTKLVGISLLKLAHGDNWTIMLFRIVAPGALAFAMIRVTKKLRGWTSYPDAFFPLALFPLEFSPEFLKACGIAYPLPTYIAGTVLLVIVQKGTRLTLGTALLSGTCLVMLPLCGGMGMVYLPALILWSAFSGWLGWRSPQSGGKITSAVTLTFTAATLLVVGLYFVDFRRGESIAPPSHNLWAVVTFAVAFLTASAGPEVAAYWWFVGLPLVLLVVTSVGVLGIKLWSGPDTDRSRALGLLAFFGAIGTLSLATAWARASMGVDYAFTYKQLPVLTLPCIYFAWVMYRPKTTGYFVQMCLFTFVCVAATLNIPKNVSGIREVYGAFQAFEQDMQNGTPPYRLIARHGTRLGLWDALDGSGQLVGLREAGIGPFRHLRNNPSFRDVPLPIEPVAANNLTWEESIAHGMGSESYLTFALPEPLFVSMIRIRSSTASTAGWGVVTLKMSWKKSDDADFSGDPQFWYPSWPADYSLNIGVGEKIDQFRIYPDCNGNPFEFGLSELVLLIPEEEESKAP